MKKRIKKHWCDGFSPLALRTAIIGDCSFENQFILTHSITDELCRICYRRLGEFVVADTGDVVCGRCVKVLEKEIEKEIEKEMKEYEKEKLTMV